jgi:hypothetical protein
MAEYRLKAGIVDGTGTLTVNGGPSVVQFIEEGTTVNMAVTLDPGFVSVEWYLNDVFQSSSLSFSFSMPFRDSSVRAVLSGVFTPVDEYGMKYTYNKTDRSGDAFKIEIEERGFVGVAEEREIESAFYFLGSRGADLIQELIVPSRLVMNLVDTGGYDDFLTGDNRKFRCRMYLAGDTIPFFTGFISPNQISYQLSTQNRGIEVTAIDGTSTFGFTRGNPYKWSGNSSAGISLSGALNQTYISKRPLNIACSVWETRMNLATTPFTQYTISEACLFENGERLTYEGTTGIVNEYIFLDEMIRRMTNIFVGRVYLWRDEWYFTRFNDYVPDNIEYYNWDADGEWTGSTFNTNKVTYDCINGVNGDFNQPQVDKAIAYNEFTATLQLGVLQPSTDTADIDYAFDRVEDWSLTPQTSTPPNVYKLSRWNYNNAEFVGQVTSRPTGTVAKVQYASEAQFNGCKIWGTTSNLGVADTEISSISLSSRNYGGDLSIVQQASNVFTLSLEFLLQSVAGDSSRRFAQFAFGIQVKIGTQYLERTSSTDFGWTPTFTIMEFDFPNESAWNDLIIQEAVVPETGEMTITLYQAICNGLAGDVNKYALVLRNFKLKVEQNKALVNEEVAWKGITNVGWNLVYPDIETFQGDAETIESTSALRLIDALATPPNPVSENWTRDGIEELKLLQMIVQEVANIKGSQPQRQIFGVTAQEPDPTRSISYIGAIFVITFIRFDVYNKTWEIELTELLNG